MKRRELLCLGLFLATTLSAGLAQATQIVVPGEWATTEAPSAFAVPFFQLASAGGFIGAPKPFNVTIGLTLTPATQPAPSSG